MELLLQQQQAAIQKERRIELAAEGHRLFDLRRWGLGVSRSATEGEFFDGSGTPAIPAARSLSADLLFGFRLRVVA